MKLTPNAKVVLQKYLQEGEMSIEDIFHRVAHFLSLREEKSGDYYEEKFFNLMNNGLFMPNSPTLAGADTPLDQLAACFVMPIEDDLGKEEDSIFNVLRKAALVQQAGGGNGFSFSQLRPKGSLIKTSGGASSGPIGFLRVFNQAFEEVAQGGIRRGANMAVLRVAHPDIEEFITCKDEEGTLASFNISVGITDAFMRAVSTVNSDWDLIDPNTGQVVKTVDANNLLWLIAKQAHKNGEPGLLFLDTANKDNPVPDLYTLESTNPCGEQWLGPYESCCLGSINLANHVIDGSIHWLLLAATIQRAVRFLDNVIDMNAYIPTVPEIEQASLRTRRIGLGVMGLADALIMQDIPYGSVEAVKFTDKLMSFIRYVAMSTSCYLAKERGPFPAYKDSVYFLKDDWYPLKESWQILAKRIKKHGLRNASFLSIAPTGTIATLSGIEGYGIEPIFALAYTRHFGDKNLQYVSPLFKQAIRGDEKIIQDVIDNGGSCQGVEGVSEAIQALFVTSRDLLPQKHLDMQAAAQKWVDNAISKTINMPSSANVTDVMNVIQQAWRDGCKGVTVYVEGSRDKVVLDTKSGPT